MTKPKWTPKRLEALKKYARGLRATQCDHMECSFSSTCRHERDRADLVECAIAEIDRLRAEVAALRADRDRLDWLIALFLGSPHGLNLWHNRALAKSAEYGDQCWGLDRLGWSRRCDEMVATRLGAGRTAREAIDKATRE